MADPTTTHPLTKTAAFTDINHRKGGFATRSFDASHSKLVEVCDNMSNVAFIRYFVGCCVNSNTGHLLLQAPWCDMLINKTRALISKQTLMFRCQDVFYWKDIGNTQHVYPWLILNSNMSQHIFTLRTDNTWIELMYGLFPGFVNENYGEVYNYVKKILFKTWAFL